MFITSIPDILIPPIMSQVTFTGDFVGPIHPAGEIFCISFYSLFSLSAESAAIEMVTQNRLMAGALFVAIALLIAILSYLFLRYRRLLRQLRTVSQVIKGIVQKELDVLPVPQFMPELKQLVGILNSTNDHLRNDYKNLEIRIIRRTSEISMRNAELRKQQREILKQNHELKSAYEALKESREKYEKLVEHLEDEYIFFSQAPNGTLLFVSPSQKKILGYDTRQFRETFLSLYTENPINITARESSANSRKGIAQPKYLLELYDIRRKPHMFEVSEVPIFNEEQNLVSVEGLAHDVTDRYSAEALIKENEEKYRMLFKHASDAIFLYELDTRKKMPGKIIEANNYMLSKLGYTLEEMRDMTPLDFLAAEFWNDPKEDYQEFLGNDKNYERIWESKDGTIHDMEISSYNFKIRDRSVAIAVARDITERKRAEEEIRYVNEELYNQKENLEALVDNLTQTQEQLVQSEKMAALGQLIAGIAHEINTPLGAIKASVGNLGESLDNALQELPELLQSQSAENLKLFGEIFDLALKQVEDLSSRDKRQKKREMTRAFRSEGIDKPDIIADLMIYLGIYDVDGDLMQALKSKDAPEVVRSARNFISLLKNRNTINIAVEKATKVVFALKKYAHRDAEGEKVTTDIIDGIETVLTLYHNQLKQGIEIEKNYEPIPLVECYQDEISQVWTNLIQNAIHAMKQEGTLTISTSYKNEMITVSFKDDGAGIEPDLKERIFEPFFTTKKQGEGSGLGLDIVKKIIDKHNGSIHVESELGEGANFIVQIPVK